MAYSKLVDAQGKLSFPSLPLQIINSLAFFNMFLFVRNLETCGLSSLSEPLHPFLLIRTHPPTMPAGQCIQKHAFGITLLRRASQVVRRLIEYALLMQCNGFRYMLFGCKVKVGWRC